MASNKGYPRGKGGTPPRSEPPRTPVKAQETRMNDKIEEEAEDTAQGQRAVREGDTIRFAGHVLRVGEVMPEKIGKPDTLDLGNGLLSFQRFVMERGRKLEDLMEFPFPKMERAAFVRWVQAMPETGEKSIEPGQEHFEWLYARAFYGADLYWRAAARGEEREPDEPIIYGLPVTRKGTKYLENVDLRTGARRIYDPKKRSTFEGLGVVTIDGATAKNRTPDWLLKNVVAPAINGVLPKARTAVDAAIKLNVFDQKAVDALISEE